MGNSVNFNSVIFGDRRMLTKLVRIGRDAELRVLPNGTNVLNFPAVYDVGFGDKKKAQWIDCAMFGKRAESLSQHFTKGKQIVIYADDLQLEEYPKNDGTTGAKLKCKIVEFDFAGGDKQQPVQQAGGFQPQQPQQGFVPQQQQPQAVQQNAHPNQSGGVPMPDFDDDVPF